MLILFNNAKSKSKAKELKFDLVLDDLRLLYKKQDSKCGWTGQKFIINEDNYGSFQPSLDKINPKGIYTPSNVVLCCWWVNRAKSDMKPTDWLKACEEITGKVSPMRKRLILQT